MIGGAVGGVLVISLILYFCWWRKRKSSLDDSSAGGWAKTPAMLDAIADWEREAKKGSSTTSLALEDKDTVLDLSFTKVRLQIFTT
jgi:hypothetical protein